MKTPAKTLVICLYSFTLLFLLTTGTLSAAEKKDPGRKKIHFDFERRVNKGDSYLCFVKQERVLEYLLAIPGAEKKLEKYESISVNFAGHLTVAKVNTAGNMQEVSVKISSLSGSVNGSPVSCENLTGRLLKGDLGISPVKFTFRDTDTPLSGDQNLLLQAVFPPAANNSLPDLTGKTRTLTPGETFFLNTEKYRKALAERKIDSTEKNLTGFCRFEGIFPFRGKLCGRFFMELKSDRIPGYQFRYRATCYIPEKKEDGPAMSIQREAVEFLTRNISPANRFASGGQLTMEAKEEASIVLLPAENLPQEQPSGGFFDLLKKK